MPVALRSKSLDQENVRCGSVNILSTVHIWRGRTHSVGRVVEYRNIDAGLSGGLLEKLHVVGGRLVQDSLVVILPLAA